MKKKHKRWSVLLMVSIFLIFWNGYLHHPQDELEPLDAFNFPADSLNFDMEKWSAPIDSSASVRKYMLKDLLANHLEFGLDTAVIKDLLGEPLDQSRDTQRYYYPVDDAESSTPHYLIIEWDAEGKIIGYKVKSLEDGQHNLIVTDLQTLPN